MNDGRSRPRHCGIISERTEGAHGNTVSIPFDLKVPTSDLGLPRRNRDNPQKLEVVQVLADAFPTGTKTTNYL